MDSKKRDLESSHLVFTPQPPAPIGISFSRPSTLPTTSLVFSDASSSSVSTETIPSSHGTNSGIPYNTSVADKLTVETFLDAISGTNLPTGLPVHKKAKEMSKSDRLLEYLSKREITSRTQFEGQPMSEIQEYITMPNLDGLLPRMFNVVAMGLRTKVFEPYTKEDLGIYGQLLQQRVCRIRRLLMGHHGWSSRQYRFFMWCLINVVNKKCNKQNCVWVYGPSNTAKTTLMASFINEFFPNCYGTPDNAERTGFPFNNCVNKRIIFWEEPFVRPQNIEDVKCIMSGSTFSTDIKYQSGVSIQKTPVIVTCNKTPWQGLADPNVMRSRCFSFKMGVVLSDKDVKDPEIIDMLSITREDWVMSFVETMELGYLVDDDITSQQVHSVD